MASWITHLRVAENLLSQIEGLESSLFAIGNIAPDSGIPDEKWEKFNPPPEVTHFRVFETTGYLPTVSGQEIKHITDQLIARCQRANA